MGRRTSPQTRGHASATRRKDEFPRSERNHKGESTDLSRVRGEANVSSDIPGAVKFIETSNGSILHDPATTRASRERRARASRQGRQPSSHLSTTSPRATTGDWEVRTDSRTSSCQLGRLAMGLRVGRRVPAHGHRVPGRVKRPPPHPG